MTQQLLKLGSAANDATGTPLQAGGQIINANFTDLYSQVGIIAQNATSVLTYGADPTGLTDSTAAFNAAVAACKPAVPFTGSTIQIGPAGDVFVPPGTYLISSQIVVNGVTITWTLADGAIITPSTNYAFLNGRILRAGKQDNQFTNGIFYNATGFSTRNNVPIDSPPAVMGFLTPSQIASYPTCDSVACYGDNTAIAPLAIIAATGTTYTTTTIAFTSPLSATILGQMRAGMIVQTTNDPVTFYSGFVTSWTSNSITVSGWFQQSVFLFHTSVTGGSGYANNTYTSVPLTGGSGSGALATIVVSGGAVTTVTVTSGGNFGYVPGDVISASNANLGGSGSGFSFTIAAQTPPNANGAWVSPISKIFGYNGNVTLRSITGSAQQAAGFEIGVLNNNAAPSGFIGTLPLVWGYDCVNLGTFACDTGFNARHNGVGFFTGFQCSGTNNAGTTVYGYFDQSIYGNSVTANGISFISATSTAASTAITNIRHFQASAAGKGAGSTISTEVGFYCAALTNATNNYGFFSQIASGANNVAFYAQGTAVSIFGGVVNLQATSAAVSSGFGLGATSQSTVGATGAATALPANPLGYMVAFAGSTKIAIPYYNG